MIKCLLLIFISATFVNSIFASEILFPAGDPFIAEKLLALEEINDIMGPGNSVDIAQQSDKVILWANSAAILPRTDDNGNRIYIETSLPSFTPYTEGNKEHLRAEITRLCQCDIQNKKVAGIIIANPYKAATMYFRAGWSSRTADEIDGDVPPVVIIYHEFSHIKDYLSNEGYFFDMASMRSKRWLNKAEESASMQQNDFTITLTAKRGISARLRRSYGKNTLYDVTDIFSF